MSREKAVSIARKIETLSTLSKAIQSASHGRKSPEEAKRFANVIFKLLRPPQTLNISTKVLVELINAVDAQRPIAELRGILYPQERAAQIAKQQQRERASLVNKKPAEPMEASNNREENANQVSNQDKSGATSEHNKRSNTLWAAMARQQEDEARAELEREKTEKRRAQAELRGGLAKQKREKEEQVRRAKMQEREQAKRVSDDVHAWEKEQQEEWAKGKQREQALVLDIQNQRQERRSVLQKERTEKELNDKRIMQMIEKREQEEREEEQHRKQQILAQAVKQKQENERLQHKKVEDRIREREEAGELGRKYSQEVERKEKQRHLDLKLKSDEVQRKMTRYTQGNKDVDMRAIENERRAAVEQAARDRKMVQEEERRVAALKKAAQEQRDALGKQVAMRRAMRNQKKQEDLKFSEKFLTSERVAMTQRNEGEALRRQQAKLQQSKWLTEQLHEKKMMNNNILHQADVSRHEIAMNRGLLQKVATKSNAEVVREVVRVPLKEDCREE